MSLIKPFRTNILPAVFINSFLIIVLSLGSGCSDDDSDKTPKIPVGATQEAPANGFKKTTLYHGKLELIVPDDFAPMGEEGLAIKYPKAKPDFAFAGDYGKVTLVFAIKNKPTTANDIPSIKESIDKKLGQAEAYQSTIKTINGQQYVVSEFISASEGGKNYNVMFMTDLDGKLLLGTLNFPLETADIWNVKKEQILSSVKKM